MKHLILLIAGAMLLPAAAHAADADARLPHLPLSYVSAFAGVPLLADAPSIEWARSNALVGALQGHAGHWRRPPPTPQADTPAAAPKADGARP
jgi:hypothetical protein